MGSGVKAPSYSSAHHPHDRRTFLACQIEIAQSQSIDEFWRKVVEAAKFLHLDYMELQLELREFYARSEQRYVWHSEKGKEMDLSTIKVPMRQQ